MTMAKATDTTVAASKAVPARRSFLAFLTGAAVAPSTAATASSAGGRDQFIDAWHRREQLRKASRPGDEKPGIDWSDEDCVAYAAFTRADKKARLTSATTRAGVSLKLELVEQAVTSGRYFDYYDLQLLRGALSDLRALS